MAKKKHTSLITITPRNPSPVLQELKQRIMDVGGKLTKSSINDAAITDLFMPLLGAGELDLKNAVYDFPDDNTLAITGASTLYKKTGLQLNIQFSLSGEQLSLTINSNPGALSLTLTEMGENGLLPQSISFPPAQWPAIPIENVQFIFDSAGQTFSVTNGSDNEWDILGYTNGIKIKNPHLTVTKQYNGTDSSFTVTAGGELKSPSWEDRGIGIDIGLPVGLLGWSVQTTKPVALDTAIGILSSLVGLPGDDILSLLPEQIRSVIENIEITGLTIQFNPVAPTTLYSVYLSLSTKKEWVIIQDILQLKQIRLSLQAQRYQAEDELSVSGSITGIAELNYNKEDDKLTIQSSIPFPAFDGQVWQISIGSGNNEIKFTKLAALIPGLKEILPDKFYDILDKIILDKFTIHFAFKDGFQIQLISFAIHSDASWQLPMLEEVLYLDQIKLSIVAENKAEGMTVTNGTISGTIEIAGGEVSIPVSLNKNEGTGNNWELNVTSDYIPLPSLDTLAPFMGRGIISSSFPVSFLDLGEFALYNIALKWRFGSGGGLQLFSFTVQSTPETIAWNLVPGYFVLSDLFVSLKIENLSPLDRDVSGSIGCTVKISIDDNPENDLVLGMLAEKASSAAPWKFFGSLQSEVNLRILLRNGLHVPEQVVALVPDLIVTQFDLAIEPNSGAFFLSTASKGADEGKWIIIQDLVVLKGMSFQVDRSADGTLLEATGSFDFFEAFNAELSAKYSSKNKTWDFNGALSNPSGLSINDVLKKYITGIDTGSIPVLTIDYIKLQLTKAEKTADTEQYTTYDFAIAGSLTINIGDGIHLGALLNAIYDSRKTSPYDGTKIQGELDFGGMNFTVIAKYANNRFSEYSFEFTFRQFTVIATLSIEKEIATFTFGFAPEMKISLGSFISAMVEAATGEQPTIPAPWDFINNILLSDFKLVFKYNTKTKEAISVGIAYSPGINLGFINIKEISLLYTLGSNRAIKFEVTKGTFLGQEIQPADKPGVDMLDPNSATPVPGFGKSLFKLETLSLGNQVQVVKLDPGALTSVAKAIAYLDAAFDQPDDGKKIPTTLVYNKDYGWLISAQFVLIEYINIGFIFYDPVIYGVYIGVKGGKFKGLDFQILYKKVNNNVGVYQIDLALPEFLRQLQFGAVAVTLPSIGLLIYTNGDFKIDLGFPQIGDFSRSFGLEMTIFIGAGGFYFAKLSNETAGDYKVPVTEKGEFNPVIAFGIGIKAGVGRTFNKGILKAELSLTIQAILEGVLAFYKPNPNNEILPAVPDENEALFYRVQAQVALVGRIYGEINFAIVTASLDIVAKIAVQLVLEAYRKIDLLFTAGVSASVTVKVNLGIFSVSISCTFSATITENFTIGQDSKAPWDLSLPFRSAAYFYALDKNRVIETVPEMNWNAPINYPKKAIDLTFLPQLSVVYKEGVPHNRHAVGVAMLYVQSDEVGARAAAESHFSTLAQAAFAWVINAYFNGEGNVLEKPVTIDNLQEIADYFNQDKFTKDFEEPFTKDQVLEHFFGGCFDSVLIKTEIAAGPAAEKFVGIFPMFPVLQMELPKADPIDFEQYNLCTAAYLEEIKKYFREMQVQYQDRQESFMSEERLKDPGEESLAEYLFKDYFVMLAKYTIQAGMDELKQTTWSVKAGQSLQSIAEELSHYGISIPELAFANRHKNTREQINITIPETSYRAAFEYTCEEQQPFTLRSIAEKFNVTLEELVRANETRPDIFAPGTRLIIPFVATMTVGELIDKLQAAHQFDNLSGMLSRFYLSGLRIPGKTKAADRTGLYIASGQQFAIDDFVENDSVTISPNSDYKEKLPWLKFAEEAERKVSYVFDQAIFDKIGLLNNSGYLPSVDLVPQTDVLRYKITPKTLTLPNKLLWQNPDLPESGSQKDCYIWAFPEKLRRLLTEKPDLPAMLEYQALNSAFSVEDPVEVVPLYWTTTIEVQLARISLTDSSGTEDMIYEVQGCSENDAQLLSLLITRETAQPEQLVVLFDRDKTAPNEGKEVKGLMSESIRDGKCFLLQTNYSHASNPPSARQVDPNNISSNIIGMDIITFCTYLWECSIVRSGGYYLYYKNTITNQGLPGYLFDEKGNGKISLLISYKIPPETGEGDQKYYKLPPYVNSVVITKDIVEGEDNLYVTPYLTEAQQKLFNPSLQEKTPLLLPGNGMFQGSRPNAAMLPELTDDDQVIKQINELYNLLEYCIQAEKDLYKQSNYALPCGPLTSHDKRGFSITDDIPIPSKEADWQYESALPLFPFVVNNDAKDPYAATAKPAAIQFNFLDVFGNYLSKDGFNQSILPGYNDVVISPDQWLNVSKHYAVGRIEGQPKLVSEFAFDAKKYVGKIEEATRDYRFFRNVFWQLSRPDVGVTLSNTLDGSTADIKTDISKFIEDIINTLDKIINGEQEPPVVEATITHNINIAAVTPDLIFSLQVAVEIERTNIDLIDPQFRDIAEVRFASSDLVPDFSSKSDNSAIYEFATALEEALPFLKVALGASGSLKKKSATLRTELLSGTTDNSNAKEVWLVRWSDGSGEKGITFQVEQPCYFAVKPLSTTLISRPDEQVPRAVPIRTYTTGEYIAHATAVEKVYSGTDIETLAGKFIATLDNFFLAGLSTEAWLLQSAHPAVCNDNPVPDQCPFEVIEKAKKDIAAAIAGKQLTNVLMPAPDNDSLNSAQKNLQEQLLIQLGNANSINSVVQCKVKIEKSNTHQAVLYGNLKNADHSGKVAYKFSPVRVSLENEASHLGSFFSLNSEGAQSLIKAATEFDAQLDLHITALEHDFQPPVNGYIASSWLSFVNPIVVKKQEAPLIDARIPVPLTAYPTAPALSAQKGAPSVKEETDQPTLEEMKQWDYLFAYDYAAAAQDTIAVNIRFNSPQTTFNNALAAEPDLFEALAQFNACCDAIINDLLNNKDAWIALQSLAWVTQKVANAWPLWGHPGKVLLSLKEKEINFSLTELKGEGENDGLLLIAIDELNGVSLAQFPKPAIEGFETVVVSATADKCIFKFRAVKNGEEAWLPFEGRAKYPVRTIIVEKLDILSLENAWGGVSVHRNKHLIADKETNPGFIYKTPYVRFANVYLPALTNSAPIDISAFTPLVIGERKQLAVFLANFFKVFFNNESEPSNTIQVECAYSYSLQNEEVTDLLNMQTRLPVLLTIPAAYSAELPGNIQQFVYTWFSAYTPKGVMESGKLNFTLSVYSSAENAGGKTPVLKLDGLYLPTNLLIVD